MRADIKQLTLGDLILNRKGTYVFKIILAAFGIALRLFFRRIETVNADVVPEKGGVIFVLNHPNGLIDPALVFVALPKKISFLAKSTLFRIPVISFILRTVDALPLYRKIDAGEDVSKNTQTFKACEKLLARGGAIALFPEGLSHNSPKLLPAKTGAARIALGTAAIADTSLMIAPVGVFYTSKTTFRSEALLHFGQPFRVPKVELDEEGQPRRDAVRDFTRNIENALREVTINAESESELHTARIAMEVLASVKESDNLGEKAEFLKKYIEQQDHEAAPSTLDAELKEFDSKLATRGLEPVHLSLSQLPPSFVIRQALLRTWRLILLLPIAAVGAALHFPAYQVCKLLANYYTHHGEDDIVSTVKVLAAMVFMPLTWIVTAGLIFYFVGWEAALISFPIAILSGYVALYSLEEGAELSGWAKAIRLFLFRREQFLRLFVQRRELRKSIEAAQ
jgi:glycerol-3-phosphate O-acyltransferase/dihydroxyacetone phosphate acyltransferase